MYVGNTMKHIQVGNVYDEDFEDSTINPILLGGGGVILSYFQNLLRNLLFG